MISTRASSLFSVFALLATTVTAQTPTPTQANAANLVNYLIPTASITSLSPEQVDINPNLLCRRPTN